MTFSILLSYKISIPMGNVTNERCFEIVLCVKVEENEFEKLRFQLPTCFPLVYMILIFWMTIASCSAFQ